MCDVDHARFIAVAVETAESIGDLNLHVFKSHGICTVAVIEYLRRKIRCLAGKTVRQLVRSAGACDIFHHICMTPGTAVGYRKAVTLIQCLDIGIFFNIIVYFTVVIIEHVCLILMRILFGPVGRFHYLDSRALLSHKSCQLLTDCRCFCCRCISCRRFDWSCRLCAISAERTQDNCCPKQAAYPNFIQRFLVHSYLSLSSCVPDNSVLINIALCQRLLQISSRSTCLQEVDIATSLQYSTTMLIYQHVWRIYGRPFRAFLLCPV